MTGASIAQIQGMEKKNTEKLIKRLIPFVALWGVTKVLERPNVRGAIAEVDSHAYIKQRKVGRSIKRAGRNAASNPAWLAAGAAAIAVGIGLMAKAVRGK